MSLDDIQVVQVEEVTPVGYAIDAVERAQVDTQVTTAKAYPRDLSRVKNNSIALVTMDKETAQSCSYSLPRGRKPITGPSVHLARILAQQYGNIRAESKVVEITDKQVVSRGTAWDLENNYAVAYEVRRSIVDRYGKRYSDDMITVTGNAANAISYRNAVLAIIPKGLIDAASKAAQELITGDLSSETKLIARRNQAIKYFKDQYNITEEEVVKLLGKHTVNQIDAKAIAVLLGTEQALKDGDTTVEELMAPFRKESVEDKKANLKNKKEDGIAKQGKLL